MTLGRAIQDRFPRYYPYFSTRSFAYRGGVYANHNKLLGRVEGMDGIKTGYTRMSGFNLLSSVQTDNRAIVAVVLGGRSGASRDRLMADLIDVNLGRAYAGARTAPPVGEGMAPPQSLPLPKPDGREAAVRASAEGRPAGEDTADDPAAVIPQPKPVAKVIDLAAARPVSPPSPAAAPRRPLPACAGRSAQQPTRTARETKVAQARNEATAASPNAKPEVKAEVRAEPRAVPKSALSGWVIQLGATDDEGKAREILKQAKTKSQKALAKAAPFTEKVQQGRSHPLPRPLLGLRRGQRPVRLQDAEEDGFSCFAMKGG